MATQYLSSIRFLKGKLLSLLEDVLHIEKNTVSSDHAGYTFIRHTDAINFRTASSVGIYSDTRGNKYIIKDYAYTLKNLEYEYLHNEINTLWIFNNQSLPLTSVRVPRIVHAQDSNGRITLITEYMEGETLDHSTQDKMQQVLIDVITYLHNLSQTTPATILKTIPNRLQILTFVMFPFYLLRALLKEPSESILFLKGCILFLRYTPHCIFQHVPYGICHRDLSADNILYDTRKKQSIILDTECTVRADILYDVALLPRLYTRYLNADQFLSIFRALHLSRADKQRLIVLMIASCIIKIATERKNTRDYTNAIHGLTLTVDTLIPRIVEEL